MKLPICLLALHITSFMHTMLQVNLAQYIANSRRVNLVSQDRGIEPSAPQDRVDGVVRKGKNSDSSVVQMDLDFRTDL